MSIPNNPATECPAPGTSEYFIKKHRFLLKSYHDWQCLLMAASATINDSFPPDAGPTPLDILREQLDANFSYARSIERKMRILLPTDLRAIDSKDQNLEILLFLKWYGEWMRMLDDAAEELERVVPMELEGNVGQMKREVERARSFVGIVRKELKEVLLENGGVVGV